MRTMNKYEWIDELFNGLEDVTDIPTMKELKRNTI
jgi:hypothetical protein